jgi:Phage integrase, N-terminal SAM-like domain
LARYRGPDGRERSKQFARRADAERFLATAEVTKAEGSWVDPARVRIRLRDWLVRFHESERQALRPNTLARDQVLVRTQILPVFGEVPLARIEHQDIQVWVNELADRLAPTTVHKCHQILRKTLAGAVRSRLLANNPCEQVQLPRVERDEMRFIAPPEIRRLAGSPCAVSTSRSKTSLLLMPTWSPEGSTSCMALRQTTGDSGRVYMTRTAG